METATSEQTTALEIVKQDFEGIQKKVFALQIKTQADKELAAESIGLLKRMMQKAEQARVMEVTPHNNTVTSINAKYKAFSQPAKELLDDLNTKLIRRQREEMEEADRARREQERLQEEARKKQEAAEKKAEKKGLPPPPPPPVKVVEVPQVQKTQTTSFGSLAVADNWIAEGEDIRALCQAIIDHKAPSNCVEFNMVFLNKEAKRVKGASPYAGVKFTNAGKVSLR